MVAVCRAASILSRSKTVIVVRVCDKRSIQPALGDPSASGGAILGELRAIGVLRRVVVQFADHAVSPSQGLVESPRGDRSPARVRYGLLVGGHDGAERRGAATRPWRSPSDRATQKLLEVQRRQMIDNIH